MNKLKIINETKIEDIIYEVRNMKVILDSDVAKICSMETKRLNETIKRNKEKFYEEDYFKLSDTEYLNLKSQFATSSSDNNYGGRRKLPYVFSENGIKILSTILKNNNMIINIINAFNSNKQESNFTIVDEQIEDLIYEFRGKQVMLDYDLARLYQCTNGTKNINLAVKRNIERFPNDFYFKLTEEECNSISRFQFETLKSGSGHNIKYLPYAFTEEGVSMLSSVLHTEVAAKVSVNIMRAFVTMKKYIGTNLLEQRNINNLLVRHEEDIRKNTEDIKLIQETLTKFDEKKVVNEIYFNGQIYDAYSKIVDIFNTCKNELIIIDGYADKTVLDMIKNLNCKVILIIKSKGNLSNLDISKYNSQYNNLKVIHNNTFHDRYFIIDKNTIYHCGTSINHAGSKTFSINTIEDNIIKDALIKNIKTII